MDRGTLRNTVIVAGFFGGALVVSYLFRIILARNLSVAEYGTFYALYAFFLLCSVLTDLGIGQGLVKQMISLRVRKQHARAARLLWTSLAIQIVCSLAVGALILLNRTGLARDVLHIDETALIVLMSIWFLTLPLTTFVSNALLAFNRPVYAGSIDIVRQTTLLALSSVFLWLGLAGHSPFIAYVTINIIIFVSYLPTIRKAFPALFRPSQPVPRGVIRQVVLYGFHVTLSGFVNVLVTQSDTVILALLLGVTAVGLYQVAVPLAAAVPLLATASMLVLYPAYAELSARRNERALREAVAISLRHITVLSVPLAVVLVSYAEGILWLLFGSQYLDAAGPLRVLALGQLAFSVVIVSTNVFLAIGKPERVSSVMALAAIMNIVLNFTLIPRIGLLGAAVATTTSFFVAAVLSLVALRHEIGVRVPLRHWVTSLGSGGIAIAAVWTVKNLLAVSPFVEAATLLAIALSAYGAMLLWTRCITIEEVRALWRLLKRA